MCELVEYFQKREFAERALDRYLKFAACREWDITGEHGKLQLYEWASHAFDPNETPADALEAFCHVYDVVTAWRGMQRRGGSWAPAEKVFNIIFKSGKEFLYCKQIGLANLTVDPFKVDGLGKFLPNLSFVRENKQYPWMAVSKVLHFANPSLFPIWDDAVMWKKVMRGVFREDYGTFCHEHGFHAYETSSQFNLNYTLWAAHCIQRSDGDFMEWFRDSTFR